MNGVISELAEPAFAVGEKGEGVGRAEIKFAQRQVIGGESAFQGLAEGLREPGVVEGGLAGAGFGIDEDEFVGVGAGLNAVPEAIVGQPMGFDLGTIHESGGGLAQRKSAVVIGLRALRQGGQGGKADQRDASETAMNE